MFRFGGLLYVSMCLIYTGFGQVEKIYINPKTNTIARQSQFVDSIKFIPFTGNDNADISVYSNLFLAKNYFMVVDHPSKTIYVHNQKGEFVKRISFK